MEDNPQDSSIAQKEAAVSATFDAVIGSLQGRDVQAPVEPQDPQVPIEQPTPAQPPATPAASTAPSQPPAPVQPTAPAQPAAQLSAPGVVTREQLHGMFSNPKVQPAEVSAASVVPPDDPIAEHENTGDKAKNAWAELRSRERALRQAVSERQKQIDELVTAQEKFQQERTQLAEALQKKDDELKKANDKLGKLDLSGSIEFRQRYDQPLQQSVANLDQVIHDTIEGADSPETIEKIRQFIVRSDDSAFQEYIAGLPVDSQGALIEKRRTFIELYAQRQQAIEKWQETSKGLTATAAQQNAADAALARQRNAEAAIRFNMVELPQDKRAYVLTDAEFGEDVRNANEEFKAFMQTATDEEMARAAYLGHLIPSMNRALLLALKECREFQEALYVQRGILRPQTRAATPEAPRPVVPPATPKTPEQMEAESQARIAETLAPLMG